MIKSFRCKDTESLFLGSNPKKFASIKPRVERKLAMLDAATTLDFLKSPPGNRLERLKGDRQGEWSIRVNEQWRLCFRFEDGDAWDVEVVDYHQ